MNDKVFYSISYTKAVRSNLLGCHMFIVTMLLVTLASSICQGKNKPLVISATKSQWKFINPAVKFEIIQDYERNYDSPFAGKPKLIWQGQGIADQTVVYELGENGDLTGYNEITFWLSIESVDEKVVELQQLFKAGSGDGNIHILLQDEEGKTAYAFFQDQYQELGKWHKLTASLSENFRGLGKLDLNNIQLIGIGFNILNSEKNREISYNFSFAEVELSRGQPKTIAKSKIHPGQYMPYQKAYLLKDYPSSFHIAMASSKESVKQAKDSIVFNIDMPKDLRFNAVSGMLVGYDIIKPEVELKIFNFAQMEDWRDRKVDVKTQDVTRDGQPYIRYSVPLDRSSLMKNLRTELEGRFSSGVDLYVSSKQTGKTKGKMFWSCSGIGLNWQSIDYEVLPELTKGQTPKRLTTVVWCGLELIPEELWPEMVSLYKAAGFNSYTNSGWLSPRIKRMHDFLNKNEITTYQAGQPAVYASWFSTDPNDKSLWAYTKDGKINPWGIACLTYCAENGEKFIEALAPFYQKAADYYPVKGLINDLELQGTTTLCYHCPRCMKAFTKYASLDPENLTPELIREKHNELFKEWHLEQNGEIAKGWIDIIRKKDPNLKAILCSGHVPYGDESADRYIEHSGTDPRLWDDEVDEHWPMMYFNGYPLCKDVEITVEVLKKPVVPLLGSGFYVGVKKFTPEQTELNVLACLLEGAGGYGFYIGFASWDAMYWDKLARLSHLAAQTEDIILDGAKLTEKVDVAGIPSESKCVLKVYRHRDKILVGAINYSENSVSPEVDLSNISPALKAMKILYLKGTEEKDVLLSGTKVKMVLDSEDAVFVELVIDGQV